MESKKNKDRKETIKFTKIMDQLQQACYDLTVDIRSQHKGAAKLFKIIMTKFSYIKIRQQTTDYGICRKPNCISVKKTKPQDINSKLQKIKHKGLITKTMRISYLKKNKNSNNI